MTPCQTKITLAKREATAAPEGPVSHLFPKQASQSSQGKRTRTATTHAEQADEHDDQQEDVGNKHRDDGRYIALDVRVTAGVLRRIPCRADLRVGRR